ncbi:MAG: zf-HC2 domain-containing protein [Planctomycetes bacterium]|nr:zf-HC2 domain-containing protein [Planctomycetota bacterium]
MKNPNCASFQGLVPGYMDGELSEEQAGPLRKHLLSCFACRGVAQELSGLAHWFPALPAAEIPRGFAARVARAAFAGETGVRRAALPATAAQREIRSTDTGLLPFVLTLTSVAASLLLFLALFLGQAEQPSGPELSAEPLPSILEELDRLNGSGSRVVPGLSEDGTPRR